MTSNRTILITGCSDGSLGSALALAFHKTGSWRVFASARNMSKLKQVKDAGIETMQLDVNSEESIAECASKFQEITGGSLDALLNNAGAGYSMPLMDIDINKARDLFDLNVFSVLRMTQAFLPLLLNSTHGAMVINNTSCSSLTAGALPLSGAYNASKAAATSLTEVMRLELKPFGIKVINLVTGSVRSTFHDNAPDATLPPTSLYNVARDTIEKNMSGIINAAQGSDRHEWATNVVKDVSKSNPPHWVWRGRFASQVRMGSLLPIGFLDSVIKRKVELEVLERKIQEKGGPSKVKLP